VVCLPEKARRAWDAGGLHGGRLEQLRGVTDKRQRGGLVAELLGGLKSGWRKPTVGDLKRKIDNLAPALASARFDPESAGCISCKDNSDVQKKLFDFDNPEQTLCLNRRCFKQKQNNHLLKHWKKTGYYRNHKTNGFKFSEDAGYDYRGFDHHKKAPAKCRECEHFLTVLDLDGAARTKQACFGEENCFNAALRSKKSPPARENDAAETASGPRVAWHGRYFREKFYQAAIPQKYGCLRVTVDEPDALEKKDRLALFALLKSNRDLHGWLAERLGVKADDGEAFSPYFGFADEALFGHLATMDFKQIRDTLAEATLQTIVAEPFGAEGRRLVAGHLGIDLKAEWRIDEEYLHKKTKVEILDIGERFGVFEQKAAKDFLFEVLLKKRGKFKSCKKGELIRVFLESGADLAGVVPEEILPESGMEGGADEQRAAR
jgi:hypothetical protein